MVMSTGSDLEQIPVDAQDASLLDPISVGSRIRGTIWPGAILYNTTTSIGSGMSPDQTSWTYITANGSHPSGEGTLQYYMPYLPVLVAAGSAGYGSYSASFVPALMTSVQCKSGLLAATPVASNEIINANNNVLVAILQDGTVAIQVTSATSVAWTCTATINNATGSVNYVSDQSGNWNISNANMSPTAFLDFSTTEARLGMMYDNISDCLGTTAGYSGWNWDSSTPESPAYPSMLMSTRLSFATAVLGFSDNRAIPQNNPTAGQAYKVVDKIILSYGWALTTTTILLLIQGFMGVLYVWCMECSKRGVHFGILQVIEMCQEAARPGPDDLPRLWGNCAGYLSDPNLQDFVAVIESFPDRNYLALVRVMQNQGPGV
jgi:hypothetical protein